MKGKLIDLKNGKFKRRLHTHTTYIMQWKGNLLNWNRLFEVLCNVMMWCWNFRMSWNGEFSCQIRNICLRIPHSDSNRFFLWKLFGVKLQQHADDDGREKGIDDFWLEEKSKIARVNGAQKREIETFHTVHSAKKCFHSINLWKISRFFFNSFCSFCEKSSNCSMPAR